MNPADWSNFVYAYFFVGTATLYGVWKAFHHGVDTIVKKALEEIVPRLTRIEYQLYNNGGESMKDSVDRIEKDLLILKAKLGE